MIEKVIILYLGWIATIYFHELGHFGKPRIDKWFPLPMGSTYDARSRYGGLIFNFVAAFLIFLINPENIYVQLFGMLNALHFVLYMFWGSFNKEFKVPKTLSSFMVYDDIPNRHAYFMVPLGVIVLFIMGPHYLTIIKTFLGVG